MRGTIIPQNGIPWNEKENTNIQVPVEDKSYSENFDRYCQIVRDIYEQQLNILDAQHGVTPHRFYSTPSNGLPLPRTVPQWALPPNYTQHDYFQQQSLVTPEKAHRSYSADFRNTSIVQENDIDSFGVSNFIKLVPPIQDFILPKYDLPTPILKYTEEPLLSPPRNAHYNKEDNQTNFEAHLRVPDSKLPIGGTHPLIGSHCSLTNANQRLKEREDQFKRPACQNLYKNSPYDLSNERCKRRRLTSHSYESHAKHCENLSLPFGLVDSTDLEDSKTTAKEGSSLQRNTVIQKDHSTKLEERHHKKFKYDCGLSKESDLAASIINQTSYSSILADPKQELLVNTKIVKSSNETDSNYEDCFKLHKYSLHLASPHLRNDEVKHLRNPSNADVNQSGVKKEHSVSQEVNKTEESTFHTVHKQAPTLWEDIEMSGQYPGHSRPPVGTPPPQTVWNHLTMTQGQVSGLNIHPTALSGAALNPAGFYAHPSMARATHLAPQLTPQLAHTQAPPTWHTPTVPSKSPGNAPGNPLFSLQMLVDNRQNQNQYRNSANSQNTLDLSATSEVPENYSRIPQDIPISLTARSVDKGSRNGNIISPPIPLNGETSSDSGISSSVPTPNSVSEPVSLSTKEMITPKITVKNFDSNLKGVSNLHDKIKEMNADNFAQKVINLPPSVTIERVTTEKKEPETIKTKDSLSVIAQVPRNVIPVIVNLTSKMDKDVTDSPKRESSSERDKKIEETSVRSPKNLPKRGKKGVDSLLEKLEGGNKKLVCTENVGSVIVMPLEEKDTCSVKSMSPERQKSKSPNREDEVVSPAFSNDDSNDNAKQRRKRKLEKPVRLSKDSKTEVEDMELEPTEPTEPRICEPVLPEPIANPPLEPVKPIERVEERIEERAEEKQEESIEERLEENQPIRRRRSSEGPSVNQTLTNQRARRKSSDDVAEFSKVMSPKGVYNANPFNEVESELEKMFAGIVETNDQDVKKKEPREGDLADSEVKDDAVLKVENGEENLTAETQIASSTSVSSTIDTKLPNKKGKKAKARGGKRKISRSSENIFSTSGGDAPQKDNKKKRPLKGSKKQEAAKKTKKNTKIDGLREMAYDSGSNASSIRSRGPVVHVEGPRDSPLSVQVVNAPREEEEEKNKEKRKNIGNGTAGRSKRLSHQNDLDFRGKVSRAGLFSSTLSSRYDAHTTDSTWVCVFCKQGPHSIVPGDPSRPHPNLAGPHIIPGTYMVPSGVLSDLFGPYLIGKERLEEGILSADEQEVMTEQKKGGKNKRSLRYAGLADQFSAKMGKKKRNSVETSSNSLFTGMTLLPGEEQRWEVWLHEQCAIWAAGVYMAGGRVTGLQEAVWDAAKSVCGSCGLTGASIGCVKRGCKAVIHYPCALTRGWLLDTNQYIPKCNLHRVT